MFVCGSHIVGLEVASDKVDWYMLQSHSDPGDIGPEGFDMLIVGEVGGGPALSVPGPLRLRLLPSVYFE